MQKENQRVALTKRLLREGLLRLLESKNISKINVSELCRESGINRATFYNHYDSPEAVLLDIETEMLAELRGVSGEPKTVEDIQRALEAACEYLQKNVKTVRILIDCRTDDDISKVFFGLGDAFRKIKAYISEKSGMDEQEAVLVSTFFAAGIYSIIIKWLTDDIDKTPAEIAALIMRVISKNYPEG